MYIFTFFFSLPLLLLLNELSVVSAVNILEITNVQHSDGNKREVGEAYHDSLLVAVETVNNRGGLNGKDKVNIIQKEVSTDPNSVATIIEEAMNNKSHNISAVFGIQGDLYLLAAQPVLEKHNLIAFSPLVGGSKAVVWSSSIMYTDVDSAMEVTALIAELVLNRHLKRISVMTTKDTAFAEHKPEQIARVLRRYGLETASTFAAVEKDSTWNFEDEWKRFMAGNPQAVLVFGEPSSITRRFIKECLQNAGNLYLGVSSVSLLLATNVARELKNSSAVLLVASTVPHPFDNRFRVSAVFREEYSNATASQLKMSIEQLKVANGAAIMRLRAWVGARMMLRGLESLTHNYSLEFMQQELFNRNNYQVEDMTFGVFSTNCSGLAGITNGRNYFSEEDKMCRCNQGAHFLDVQEFLWAKANYVSSSMMLSSLSTCRDAEVHIDRTIVLYRPICDLSQLGFLRRMTVTYAMEHDYFPNDLEMLFLTKYTKSEKYPPNVTLQSHKKLYSIQENHYVTMFAVGFVRLPLPEDITTAVIAPIMQKPRPRKSIGYQRNVIHLFPLIDDEFIALASYIYFFIKGERLTPEFRRTATVDDIIDAHISALVFDINFKNDLLGQEGYKDIMSTLRRAFDTFLITIDEEKYFPPDTDFNKTLKESRYPANSFVFISELTEELVPAFSTFLQNNPTVKVILPFTTVALLYHILLDTVQDINDLLRIVFATAIPAWTIPPTPNPSVTVQSFYEMVKDKKEMQDPMAMMGFLARRFIEGMATGLFKQATSRVVLREIYSQSTVVVDSKLSFGPFYDDACVGLISRATCEKNYVSASMRVRNLATESGNISMNDSRAIVYNLLRTDVETFPLPEAEKLPKWVIPVAVIAGVLLVALVILLIFMLCCRKSKERDVRNAPKNPNEPFTIMFTDIQRSTSLWAEIPELMPEALDTHHRLIRELITKHRGYEVKTIGDAFMIAFQRASDALSLAYDLQFAFYDHLWGYCDIDECYKAFEEEFIEENQDNEEMVNVITNLTCRLSQAKYDAAWHGLRVRIGIATGFGEIKLDEITGGYDYYGGVSNVAARTETAAYGGQVLCTAATVQNAASEGVDMSKFDLLDLGPQPLRGVPDPVVLYQLQNVPGRRFGPLRLDVPCAKDIDEDTGTSDTAAYEQNREDEMLVAIMYVVISTLFSTSGKKKRQTDLQQLCRVWRLKAKHHMLRYNRYIGQAVARKHSHQPSAEKSKEASASGNLGRTDSFATDLSGAATGKAENTTRKSATSGYTSTIHAGDGDVGVAQTNTAYTTHISSRNEAKIQNVSEEDDKFIGVLSAKLSSVVLKKLPRSIARLLVKAASDDRKKSEVTDGSKTVDCGLPAAYSTLTADGVANNNKATRATEATSANNKWLDRVELFEGNRRRTRDSSVAFSADSKLS